MPLEINPTPALCSVCSHFAWRALDEKWDDLFAPILANEIRIHETAFRVYVYATENKVGKHPAFEIFKASLTAARNNFWGTTEFDIAMKEAFKGYWKLAVAGSYWQPEKHRIVDGWLQFPQTIEIWKFLEEPTIADWKVDLQTWRSDN